MGCWVQSSDVWSVDLLAFVEPVSKICLLVGHSLVVQKVISTKDEAVVF